MLCILPNVLFGADDACTKPAEYTVDKRCYVTDEQKTQAPFNATVAILSGDELYCTGTIVNVDNELYMITAAHCVDIDEDGRPDNTINMKLQDERYLTVKYLQIDDKYDYSSIYTPDKYDWAVYRLDNTDLTIPTVQITDGVARNEDVMSVGYGALKIMSDQEIKDFKQEYIDFLTHQNWNNFDGVTKSDSDYSDKYDDTIAVIKEFNRAPDEFPAEGEQDLGVIDNSMVMLHPAVQLFIEYYNNQILQLLHNLDLKVSYCQYSLQNDKNNCQGWAGNSGGGIFNSHRNLVAINTAGLAYIGGENHAKTRGARLSSKLLKTIHYAK